MTVRLWTSVFALILVVGVVLAPAIAQRLNGDSAPGHIDPEMTSMMSMMDQMADQMELMHQQMGSMHGTGPMRGRMERMIGMMDHMNGMMEQHRAQMERRADGPNPSRR